MAGRCAMASSKAGSDGGDGSQATVSCAAASKHRPSWFSRLESGSTQRRLSGSTAAGDNATRRSIWAARGSEGSAPSRRSSWASRGFASAVAAVPEPPKEFQAGDEVTALRKEEQDVDQEVGAASDPSTPTTVLGASPRSGKRRGSWRSAAKAALAKPALARGSLIESKASKASTDGTCIDETARGAGNVGASSLAAAWRERKSRLSMSASAIANAHSEPAASSGPEAASHRSAVDIQSSTAAVSDAASEESSAFSGSETFEDMHAEAKVDDMMTRLNQLIATISQATGLELSITSNPATPTPDLTASLKNFPWPGVTGSGSLQNDVGSLKLSGDGDSQFRTQDLHEVVVTPRSGRDAHEFTLDVLHSGAEEDESSALSRSQSIKSPRSPPPRLGRINSEKVLKMLDLMATNIAAVELEERCEALSPSTFASEALSDSTSCQDGQRQRRATAPPVGTSERISGMRRVSARQPMQRRDQDTILRLREQEAENALLTEQLDRLRDDLEVLRGENKALQLHSAEINKHHQQELSALHASLEEKMQEMAHLHQAADALRRENVNLESRLSEKGSRAGGDESLQHQLAMLHVAKHPLELQKPDLEEKLQQHFKVDMQMVADFDICREVNCSCHTPRGSAASPDIASLKTPEGKRDLVVPDARSAHLVEHQKLEDMLSINVGELADVEALRALAADLQVESGKLREQVREVAKLHEWLQCADPDTPGRDSDIFFESKHHLDVSYSREGTTDGLRGQDEDSNQLHDISMNSPQQAIQNLISRRQEFARLHESAEGELVQIRKLSDNLRAENQRLEVQCGEVQKAEEQASGCRQELDVCKRKHARQMDELREDLGTLRCENRRLQLEIAGVDAQNNRMEELEANKAQIVEVHHKQLAELQASMDELKSANINLQLQEQNASNEVSRLGAEENRLVDLLRSAEAQGKLQEATVKALRNHESKLEAREEVFQSLASELRAERKLGSPLIPGRPRSQEFREEEFLDLTDEIQNLRKDRQKVLKYSDEMQQSLEAKDAELARLSTDIGKLRSEHQALVSSSDHILVSQKVESALCVELEAEVEKLESKGQLTLKKNDEVREAQEAKEWKFGKLEGHVNKLRSEHQRVLAESQERLRSHEAQMCDMRSERSIALQDAQALSETVEELRSSSGHFKSQEQELAEDHKAALRAINSKVEHQEAMFAIACNEKINMEMQHAELAARSERFETQEQELKAALDAVCLEKSELEAQNLELTELSSNFKSEERQVAEEHQATLAAVCSDRSELMARHRELSESSRLLKWEEQELVNRHQIVLAAANTEKSELEALNAEICQDFEFRKQELVEHHTTALSIVLDERSSFEAQSQELMALVGALRDDCTRVEYQEQQSVQNHTAALHDAFSEKSNFEAQCAQLERHTEALSSECGQLKSQERKLMEHHAAALETAHDARSRLEARCAEFEMHVETSRCEHLRLESQEHELAMRHMDALQIVVDEKTQLQAQSDELNEYVHSLRSEHGQLEWQQQAAVERHTAALRSISDEKSVFEAHNVELLAQTNALRSEHRLFQCQQQELMEKNMAALGEICNEKSRLEDEFVMQTELLRSARGQFEEHEQRLAERYAANIHSLFEEKSEIEDLAKRHATSLQVVLDEKSELEVQYYELEMNTEVLRGERDEIRQELAESNAAIFGRSDDQMSKLEVQCDEFVAHIEALRSERGQSESEATESVDGHTVALHGLLDDKFELDRPCAALVKLMEELLAKVNTLKSEYGCLEPQEFVVRHTAAFHMVLDTDFHLEVQYREFTTRVEEFSSRLERGHLETDQDEISRHRAPMLSRIFDEKSALDTQCAALVAHVEAFRITCGNLESQERQIVEQHAAQAQSAVDETLRLEGRCAELVLHVVELFDHVEAFRSMSRELAAQEQDLVGPRVSTPHTSQDETSALEVQCATFQMHVEALRSVREQQHLEPEEQNLRGHPSLVLHSEHDAKSKLEVQCIEFATLAEDLLTQVGALTDEFAHLRSGQHELEEGRTATLKSIHDEKSNLQAQCTEFFARVDALRSELGMLELHDQALLERREYSKMEARCAELGTHVQKLLDERGLLESQERALMEHHAVALRSVHDEQSKLEVQCSELSLHADELRSEHRQLQSREQAQGEELEARVEALRTDHARLKSQEQESVECHVTALQSYHEEEKSQLEAHCAELMTVLETERERFGAREQRLVEKHAVALRAFCDERAELQAAHVELQQTDHLEDMAQRCLAVCSEKAELEEAHGELLKVSALGQELANRNADMLFAVQGENALLEEKHAELRKLHAEELKELRTQLHETTAENERLLALEQQEFWKSAERTALRLEQKEFDDLREANSKLLGENCRLEDRLRDEISRPAMVSPIQAAEPASAILSLPGDSLEGSVDGILVDEQPWLSLAQPDKLVLHVLERLAAMQKTTASGHNKLSRSVDHQHESQLLAAVHIHIYMRREECRNLCGTFTYVFV